MDPARRRQMTALAIGVALVAAVAYGYVASVRPHPGRAAGLVQPTPRGGLTASRPWSAWGNLCGARAIGSVVERLVHTEEVTGSNPVSPTPPSTPAGRRPSSGGLRPFVVGTIAERRGAAPAGESGALRVRDPAGRRRRRAVGGGRYDGRRAVRRPPRGRRGPRRRRAARPAPATRRRRRGRAGRDRQPGRSRRAAALDRARARPGGAGPLPRGQAGHRPADRQRLLLRLRRRDAVHPRRPRAPREAHAGDHQVRAAVRPAGGRRGRGPRRAGRRAVQARADRAQGRRRRRRGDGGRRRRAHHLRQRRRQDRRALLGRPVPRPAPADDPATSRRSS